MYSYKNLSFYYGKKKIYNDLNFELNNCDVVILVGNNGEGKTTLLKNIIKYNKLKNYSTNMLIGKIPFYNELTAYQNLVYYCIINKISYKCINDLLIKFNVLEYKNIKFNKLSLGTKQKFAIIRSLLTDSLFYIFDEPINGLDYKSIQIFNDIILDLKEKQKIIIIATHLINESLKVGNKFFYLNNYNLNIYNKNSFISEVNIC